MALLSRLKDERHLDHADRVTPDRPKTTRKDSNKKL